MTKKFEIKNRFTDKIIVEGKAENFKEFIKKNKAKLSETNLWGRDLSETDLWGTDLRETDLRGTNLSGADLRGTDLRGAILQGAILWGTNLSGAKIKITQREELLKSLGVQIIE